MKKNQLAFNKNYYTLLQFICFAFMLKTKRARTTDTDIEIGKRLQCFREKLDITQTELGESAGVSFQQVQKYEKGANRIHAETLWKIACTYGVDIGFFFPDKDLEKDGESECEISDCTIDHNDKLSMSLLKAYLSIEDYDLKKRIFSLIASLIK